MQNGLLRGGVAVFAIGLALAGCTKSGKEVAASGPTAAAAAGQSARNAATPVPVVLRIPAPAAVADGSPAPIQLTAGMARQALHRGELEIELADGTRYPVRMEREQAERGGQATFIGRVETKVGPQTAVLTFGPDAVFGVLPRPDGMLLSITTTRGVVGVGLDGGLVPKGKDQPGNPPDFVVPAQARGIPVHQVPTPAQGNTRLPDSTTAKC